MDFSNTKLESNRIGDNCYINIHITQNEESYIFELNYKEGRFISERVFPNTRDGVAAMEEMKDAYKNENDVLKYFGLI